MQRYQVQRAPIRVAHIHNVVLGEPQGLRPRLVLACRSFRPFFEAAACPTSAQQEMTNDHARRMF